MGLICDARLGGVRREARETELGIGLPVGDVMREGREVGFVESGGIMVSFRRYMSFTIVPLTNTLPLLERKIELLPRVDTTPALSSWTPLIKFVRAAGM